MRRVLSLDGGGIRGLISALVLKEIEAKTGRAIWSLFDLIAGTSTGGILALGLTRPDESAPPGEPAAKYSAAALAELYVKHGRQIFPRSLWRGVSNLGGLTDEKYSHDGLEGVLEQYFGETPIGDALTHAMVTTYDIQNRAPFFIKSWKPDRAAVEMRHAARATSAAPTYFEPALVGVAGSIKALVDGGVFINNPAMSAYAEARVLFPEEDAFFVVSIGTGELIRPISYEDAKDWGLAGWALPILSLVFDGVSDAVDYQLEHILGQNHVRLQIALSKANDDMDDASDRNLDALKSEASRLIRSQRAKIEKICGTVVAG